MHNACTVWYYGTCCQLSPSYARAVFIALSSSKLCAVMLSQLYNNIVPAAATAVLFNIATTATYDHTYILLIHAHSTHNKTQTLLIAAREGGVGDIRVKLRGRSVTPKLQLVEELQNGRLNFDPVLLLPTTAAPVTPAAAVSTTAVIEGAVTPVMPEVKPSSQTVFTLRNDSPMALPFQMKVAVTRTVEKQALQGVFVFEPSSGVLETGASLAVQAQFVPGTARDTPFQQDWIVDVPHMPTPIKLSLFGRTVTRQMYATALHDDVQVLEQATTSTATTSSTTAAATSTEQQQQQQQIVLTYAGES
eukprot:13385-Heterococcus_DN1.PRE.4